MSHNHTSGTNANGHAVVHLSNCTRGGIVVETAGCVLKIPNEQTVSGIHYTTLDTGTERKDLLVHKTIRGAIITETNFICHLGGIFDGEEGELDGTDRFTGFNNNQGEKGAEVSIETEERETEEMP